MATAALFSMIHPAAQQTAAPMATSGTTSTPSSSSDSSSSDSATITANDFLTLLVTEMKNQDPTADTDPNEYINQLVQVNSLQQLISINQVLSTSLDPSSGTTPDSSTPSDQVQSAQVAAASKPASETSSLVPAAQSVAQTAGNLGIPHASASSIGVAHALDGTSRNVPAPFPALQR